jgi:hypothetical protein
MTIQIELTPEEDAWLRQQAARRGQPPDRLLQEMLRAQIRPRETVAAEDLQPVLDADGTFHPERWERVLQLLRGFPAVPTLPHEALTREAMYQDHD